MVTPLAPAFITVSAAVSTDGIPISRWLRNKATLFRFTLNEVIMKIISGRQKPSRKYQKAQKRAFFSAKDTHSGEN
jgi:hypothetical protein